MTREVLLMSDCKSVISKTTAILESLDHKSLTLTSEQLRNDSTCRSAVLAALVALDDSNTETAAIAEIKKSFPNLPVFLLHPDQQFFERNPNSRLNSRPNYRNVAGTIRLPVRYRDMIEVLKQAQLKRAQDKASKNDGITITGDSPRISAITKLIRQVAPTEANVLLSGESGTGKEVVARSIHNLSLRSDCPFVAVNCGAIPPELLESELFGHEKGAFTGAFQARAGRFELAQGGTLFLDEIGDMPLNMQVKLLRVIQERTFERVGGTRTIKSDVRLIAATHQDLEKRIDDGEFRMDLFYRLNVFPIELPPLRERSEDIPLLIREFIERKRFDQHPPISLSDDALQTLMNHPLPGNVRELENLIERLTILYPGETVCRDQLPQRYCQQRVDSQFDSIVSRPNLPEELPTLSDGSAARINLKQYLASLERSLICRALEQSDWVVTQAARTLSVRRTTLIEKIRKLEIRQPAGEERRTSL